MRLFFVVLLCLIPLLLVGNDLKRERSGLWVVRYAVTTKSDIDKIISTAIDLNISDIFFQVRALGQTYYNSQWEKKAPNIEEEFDPLEYVTKKSVSSGIRIHAWVNMFYVWAGNQFPDEKNHTIHKHFENVLRHDSFPDYKSLKRDGHEGFFLDPKSVSVQDDLLKIIQEIAASYNVAGIHLDYFRYPSLTYSFTPASRTMYMMGHFYDPLKIYRSSETYSEIRGYEVFLHADREYRKSLTDALNSYLGIITNSVKKVQPHVEISVAVKPDPVQAKHRYFQDWLSWLKDDICDFVVLMNYRTKWNDFDSVLKQLSDRNMKEKIIVGISTYNQNVDAVLKRIEASRQGEFTGYSLFSYNHLFENRAYLVKLQQQIMARR